VPLLVALTLEGYLQLRCNAWPGLPTSPRHNEICTASCAPGLASFSQTSSSFIPWLLSDFIPSPAPLAMQMLHRTLAIARNTLPTLTAKGMCSAQSLLKHGMAQPRCHAIPLQSHPRLLPSARASECRLLSCLPTCTASCPCCSVVTSLPSSKPPHHTQGFRLDQGQATALLGGSALGCG
jgi:hypothetical protein